MHLLLQASLLFAPLAHADEEAAETCLRTKIWDGYSTGWQVRSQSNTTLGQGEHRVYLITLYAGNEYKFMACGDDEAANLDLVLYDAKGNVLFTDNSSDREPSLTYSPTVTDTFYLAVHGSRLNDPAKKSGVSTAVSFK
jgi:hypothetical protein